MVTCCKLLNFLSITTPTRDVLITAEWLDFLTGLKKNAFKIYLTWAKISICTKVWKTVASFSSSWNFEICYENKRNFNYVSRILSPKLPTCVKKWRSMSGCSTLQLLQTVKMHLPRMVCQVRDDNVQKTTCCVATASKSHRAYIFSAKHLL